MTSLVAYKLQLKMGLKPVHPFGSQKAIKELVHLASADSLAEILGTSSVFGKLETDAHTESLRNRFAQAYKCTHL